MSYKQLTITTNISWALTLYQAPFPNFSLIISFNLIITIALIRIPTSQVRGLRLTMVRAGGPQEGKDLWLGSGGAP